MEREARMRYEAQQVQNKRRARQDNVARAEGFIHTSKGVIFYKDGTGRKNGKK